MRAMGITFVRLGELAWSRLEPRPGQYGFEWLDEALAILADHELRAVLGTPTAAPPKWLVDRHPEILPVDVRGQRRRYGGRRHSCFSSPAWRAATTEIVTTLSARYGRHPAVAGWQVDNEYGGHDTARCYCQACAAAFREWLLARYVDIDELNARWGNAFWSQDRTSFAEIDPPLEAVAETHPAWRLEYFRFASSQVSDYNRMQCEIIRRHSPDRFVTHNFMGFFDAMDAFSIAKSLDFAAWDSYPLGLLQISGIDDPEPWTASGHPDLAAFHHDLYRRAGRGRFWVMEQQAGPIDWGTSNPVPAPGMVRLWTWEALAHGAEVVSWFPWRQAGRGQEQMHGALLRPDDTPDDGYAEAWRVARELEFVRPGRRAPAPVALIFDFEAAWTFSIQPHGDGPGYFALVLAFYQALRLLGLDVDIIAAEDDRSDWPLAVAPSLPIWRGPRDVGRPLVVGPRTATRTADFAIDSEGLGTGRARMRSVRCESVPRGRSRPVTWGRRAYPSGPWREWIASDVLPVARFDDGDGALYEAEGLHWIAFWPTVGFLVDYFEELCRRVEIPTVRLPPSLRLRRRGDLVFAFQYGDDVPRLPVPADTPLLLGSRDVGGPSVVAWRPDPDSRSDPQ
jgi:beta-galactosidase